ncbi:hypothetical protein CXR25_17060 [Brevibacterium aurantiacum]|uniref:Uncharacterized protein n=3 Tax=Brevibacterium aurantiacum TaxID=273384 RepID=A0A2A3YU78_BREAU|nr:hypothetical protein CXR25_17060 [Brevibacterium aurantiacum]AZT98660.1 hypothetical protein CXR27_17920 [Brevibacterium aurantiacum]PCC42886.1 hypothetical protein CIK65_10185 [Brevibacterium aurantiacum]PCC45113.1 hypothetical protein CIK64_17550 [Brevibacterium aurantiacum]PCC55174.1 hypothetical protein CIK59_02410 [Brevibacterium aurantiacum]
MRLTVAESKVCFWKLATVCQTPVVIAYRRTSPIGARLRTEEYCEDLRALVWRGNEDARVVLDALERLDVSEEDAVVQLDEVAVELEFFVRQRRMSRKVSAIEGGEAVSGFASADHMNIANVCTRHFVIAWRVLSCSSRHYGDRPIPDTATGGPPVATHTERRMPRASSRPC